MFLFFKEVILIYKIYYIYYIYPRYHNTKHTIYIDSSIYIDSMIYLRKRKEKKEKKRKEKELLLYTNFKICQEFLIIFFIF